METISERVKNIRDYEAHIQFLKSEISEKTSELNALQDEIHDLREDKNKFLKDKEQLEFDRREHSATVANDLQAVMFQSELFEMKKKEHFDFVELNRVDLKNSLHKLGQLNEKCLSADKDILGKQKTIEILNRQIHHLSEIVCNNEEMVQKNTELKEEQRLINNSIEESRVRQSELIASSEQELKRINDEKNKAIEDRNQADYQKKDYLDRLQTAKGDWLIVRARLEDRFHQHYPELELPLAI